jgi:hypothetical protein
MAARRQACRVTAGAPPVPAIAAPTQHDVVAPGGERQAESAGLDPADRGARAGWQRPGDGQHRGVDVDPGDVPGPAHAPGCGPGHHSGPAGDIQDPLAAAQAGAFYQVGSPACGDHRHEVTLVESGRIAAELPVFIRAAGRLICHAPDCGPGAPAPRLVFRVPGRLPIHIQISPAAIWAGTCLRPGRIRQDGPAG